LIGIFDQQGVQKALFRNSRGIANSNGFEDNYVMLFGMVRVAKRKSRRGRGGVNVFDGN
jgi:hypothetical protein